MSRDTKILTIFLTGMAIYCSAALLVDMDTSQELNMKYLAAIGTSILWPAAFVSWKASQDYDEHQANLASPVVEAILIFLVVACISLYAVQTERNRIVEPKIMEPVKT